VDHLPEVAVFLAQTVMEAAVHSGAVAVEEGREASPVAAFPEVSMVVDLGASTEEVGAFMVAVAAADNYVDCRDRSLKHSILTEKRII
jgi:hypothetical protein